MAEAQLSTFTAVVEGVDDCLDKTTVMELMADGLDARYAKDSYIVGYVIRELKARMERVRSDLLRLDAELHQH